jgi:hypothetical protein
MDRFDKLEKKLDKQDERIDKVDICLTEIRADLKEHMRRTAAAERANELTQEALDIYKKESDARLRKLESLKEKFHFVGWLFAGILGFLETMSKLGFLGIHH